MFANHGKFMPLCNPEIQQHILASLRVRRTQAGIVAASSQNRGFPISGELPFPIRLPRHILRNHLARIIRPVVQSTDVPALINDRIPSIDQSCFLTASRQRPQLLVYLGGIPQIVRIERRYKIRSRLGYSQIAGPPRRRRLAGRSDVSDYPERRGGRPPLRFWSLDPSSTTSISKLRCVWARALRSVFIDCARLRYRRGRPPSRASHCTALWNWSEKCSWPAQKRRCPKTH